MIVEEPRAATVETAASGEPFKPLCKHGSAACCYCQNLELSFVYNLRSKNLIVTQRTGHWFE
jgi:hypothetical protein